MGQVLDELGVSMGKDMSAVPMSSVAGAAKQEAKADEAQGNIITHCFTEYSESVLCKFVLCLY